MNGRGWSPTQLALLALAVVVIMLWLNPWRGADPNLNQPNDPEVTSCVSTHAQ